MEPQLIPSGLEVTVPRPVPDLLTVRVKRSRVKVGTTDLDAFIRYKDLRKEYYGDDLPAATWVQVARLYQPAFVVEVQVTAVYPR